MANSPSISLLGNRETATALGIIVRTLDRIVASGKLRSIKLGHYRKFRPEDISAYLDGLYTQEAS
jgi:excisionase family DNA binding protein